MKNDSVNEYVKAVKEMAIAEGIEEANKANHEALERKLINLEQFKQAARVLVKMYLAR